MKEVICDICRKRIEPKDIHVELELRIGDKPSTLDFHNLCYLYFIQELRKATEDERL